MRIAIVNQSPIATHAIMEAVLETGTHSVIWTAENGRSALMHCQRDCPDLVLLDLQISDWDGVETTSQLLGVCATAVLIVTASVSEHCGQAFHAMGAGAIDAIDSPMPGDKHKRRAFLEKLSQIEAILTDEDRGESTADPNDPIPSRAIAEDLIVFGASAGGPAALAEVLKRLGPVTREAVVIVQHVDQRFVSELADWLSGFSDRRVEVVRDGDRLRCGEVVLSAGNAHLVAQSDGSMCYELEPVDLPYRPSVDVFFSSLAKCWTGRICATVLTGMGRDGAIGLAALRAGGHLTIAQDRESSALYGMPKAAADSGAACEILPLNAIPRRIHRWLRNRPAC